MKIELIDNYKVHIEDKNLKKAVFTDYYGKEHTILIDNKLKLEFTKRRREKYAEKYRERRYLGSVNIKYCLIMVYLQKMKQSIRILEKQLFVKFGNYLLLKIEEHI